MLKGAWRVPPLVRPFLSLLVLGLVLPALGAEAASPCRTEERVVPFAGGTATLRTDACHDVLVTPDYARERWWNVTTFVSMDGAVAANTVVTTLAYRHVYVTAAGTSEYEGRLYGASTYDADNPAYRGGVASVGNDQSRPGSACSEASTLTVGGYGPASYMGASATVHGGSAPGALAPCTPGAVRDALP